MVSSGSSTLDKNDASWIVRRGLADNSCVSFESRNDPGDFLRHYDYQLYRQPMDGSAIFRTDATFCPEAGKSGTGTSFRSYNYPSRDQTDPPPGPDRAGQANTQGAAVRRAGGQPPAGV